jgi:hypothetical protein
VENERRHTRLSAPTSIRLPVNSSQKDRVKYTKMLNARTVQRAICGPFGTAPSCRCNPRYDAKAPHKQSSVHEADGIINGLFGCSGGVSARQKGHHPSHSIRRQRAPAQYQNPLNALKERWNGVAGPIYCEVACCNLSR